MQKRLLAIIIMAVAAFIDLLDGTIANIALPTIQQDIHATPFQLQWIMAGYIVAFGTMLMTGGRLGDIFGRKRIFLIGVAGFTLASLGSALAESGSVLVAARIIQGLFAGLMVPQLNSSVVALYKPEERAPIWGILGALVPLGTITGMLLGGWLVTANILETSWRSVFLINVPIGVVTFVAALLFVPDTKPRQRAPIDIAGVLLSGAGVSLLIYALSNSASDVFWIIILIAAGLLAIFLVQQRRRALQGKIPLLPLQLFRSRGYSRGVCLEFLFAAASGSYGIVLTFLAQQALQLTPLETGLLILPLVVSAIIISPLVVNVSKRYPRSLIAIGGGAQALAFFWIIWLLQSQGTALGQWGMVLPFILAGIGTMFVAVPLNDLTLASIAEENAGIASGLLTTLTQIGMAVGVTVAGSVFFSAVAGQNNPVAILHGASIALWVCVIAYLLVGAAAIIMPRRKLM